MRNGIRNMKLWVMILAVMIILSNSFIYVGYIYSTLTRWVEMDSKCLGWTCPMNKMELCCLRISHFYVVQIQVESRPEKLPKACLSFSLGHPAVLHSRLSSPPPFSYGAYLNLHFLLAWLIESNILADWLNIHDWLFSPLFMVVLGEKGYGAAPHIRWD